MSDLGIEQVLQAHAQARRHCTLSWDCLVQCGLRGGLARAGQFCIDMHLPAALKGDVQTGLFFRGSEPCLSAPYPPDA